MTGRSAHPPSGAALATAAVITAGLVATSSVALVVVARDRGPEPAASASGFGIGGVAAQRSRAVSAQSPHASATPRPSSAVPSGVVSPEPASSPVAQRSPAAPVVYQVRPGDNLTAIARWFKLHGYGELYRRNAAVIGADPDLIRPGQVITVSPAGATISR